MNEWIITDKVYLYKSWDGEKISIANPESKNYWGPVQKTSESVEPPILVDNTGSEIMISSGKVYLKVSDKYIKIANLYHDNLITQFSEATLTAGKSSGVIFGFSLNNPGKTTLVFPGTTFYKETEKELLRRTNLSLHRKTTKYIPGHRYELETGSLWYIGDYYTNMVGAYDDYVHNRKTLSHVFSNYLPESKKLSDIFKDSEVIKTDGLKYFSSEENYSSKIIVCSERSLSMVDSGQELDLDISLEDAYELRVLEFEKNQKKEYTPGSERYYYPNFNWMLSLFSLLPNNKTSSSIFSQSVKDGVTRLLTSDLEYLAFKYHDPQIPVDVSAETLTYQFEQIFLRKIGCSSGYLKTMLEYISDKKLLDLMEEVVSRFACPSFITFQDYINNIGYYEYRKEGYYRIIDFVYCKESMRKMSKHFPEDCPLRDLLVDMYKKALDTWGSNIDDFNVENVGTATKPVFRFKFWITLKDIMNHFKVKDPNDIPEEIKKDLMEKTIYSVRFITGSNISPKLNE